MKPMTMLGVVLILLGVVALVYQGITYTSRETVIDIGPLHATADRQKTLPLSPVLGIVALAGRRGAARHRCAPARVASWSIGQIVAAVHRLRSRQPKSDQSPEPKLGG